MSSASFPHSEADAVPTYHPAGWARLIACDRANNEYDGSLRPTLEPVIRTIFRRLGGDISPVTLNCVPGRDSICIMEDDLRFLKAGQKTVQRTMELERRLEEHREAEKALRKACEELERWVVERTAELARATERLQSEIDKRVMIEDDLRRERQTHKGDESPPRQSLSASRDGVRHDGESVPFEEVVDAFGGAGEIVGESRALKTVLRAVDRVAGTDSTVLILGETGTGKELIAEAVHKRSRRKDRRFVKVNCAALPGTLIESELFGHEKGAFTGALTRKIGRFESADGGSIFLDEIGDVPLDLQVKLLRVLQDGEFERVGSSDTRKVNVRLIAATNRSLETAVARGDFRADLYYRLNVFPISLPPLRDRREDIPLLVDHILATRKSKLGKSIVEVPYEVMEALKAYHWPGNVRELENVIEHSVILSAGSTLTLCELFGRAGAGCVAGSHFPSLQEVERAHILRALDECGWRIRGRGNAADRLGLNPSTLRSRMNKLGIQRPAK
jgi:formate hydrogenlyase transcriptional activator